MVHCSHLFTLFLSQSVCMLNPASFRRSSACLHIGRTSERSHDRINVSDTVQDPCLYSLLHRAHTMQSTFL